MEHLQISAGCAAEVEAPCENAAGNEIIDLLMTILSDRLDHPELWPEIGGILQICPELPHLLIERINIESDRWRRVELNLILLVCLSALGQLDRALAEIEPIMVTASQSALIQGVAFYLEGLKDPENPKYRLAGKICRHPFQQFDVLERSAHLCCASFLNKSVGDLSMQNWEAVWNSDIAQDIRASIHDGSYRYCNKMSCSVIQAKCLDDRDSLMKESEKWNQILSNQKIMIEEGPITVNLAYDRTCNLSCPSCRMENYAADQETRERFEDMQNNKILPLLKNAETVFVTGSGDPFASKNFRSLMKKLTIEEYPALKFQIMTNGMLFTSRQWEMFPMIHGRVKILKISIDAACGPTHELLRRGARWSTMLENMKFAGTLTAAGLVEHFELVFVVQTENYREMGDAVDLAKSVGAKTIFFARLTNWGTFSNEQYQQKAVFLRAHPLYEDFMSRMADPRLLDPIVVLGDLENFLPHEDGTSSTAIELVAA